MEQPFKKPPPEGDHESPPKPRRYWWRFLTAAVVIVAITAASVAGSGLIKVEEIAEALGHNERLKNRVGRILTEAGGGEPQNILILGSDKRAGEEGEPSRSDTTILLRLDPDLNAIGLMSIPRDLKVEIPGVGTDRFGAAYAYGGPALTLKVVKELTGLRINHVVNVDFLGFARAVDAIGCVFVDVDRRYYHSNEGVPPAEQYAEIDVEPGYQKLCGKEALDYVRYRHTDTDIVRAARQQDFLAAARQRVPVGKLAGELLPGGDGELIDIFTDYTTSDISETKTMLDVLKLFLASRNARINEVDFPAELGEPYVRASKSAIEGAVQEFLGVEDSGGPRGSLEKSGPEMREQARRSARELRRDRAQDRAEARRRARKERREKEERVKVKPPGEDGLVEAVEPGAEEARRVLDEVGGGFPVFFPTRLPSGAIFEITNPDMRIDDPRVYHLRDTGSEPHGAYRMVLKLDLPDGIHYFGVQGIRGWEDPPLLGKPSLTETINNREYDIFLDGDRIKLISWHRGANTYWVANSLLRVLTNEQMVGMARSMVGVVNPRPRGQRRGQR